MRALHRPLSAGARSAVLIPGLAVSFLAFGSQSVGHQDLASLLAARSGADQTWRRHIAAQAPQSLRMASFAFARPIPRDDSVVGVQRVRFTVDEANFTDPRRSDRFFGPAVGVGAERPVIYPQVNRVTKGDLLAERPKLRANLPAPRATASLLAAPDVLTATSTFTRRPDLTEDEASVAGLQLAAVNRGLTLTDQSPAGRLGLTGPVFGEVDPIATHEPADVDARFPTELPEDRAGIAVSGDGPIARASVGMGAPSIPLDSEPFRIASTHEPVAGFDPILGGLSTDRRGDRPDLALQRLFQPPAPLSLRRTDAEITTGVVASGAHAARAGHPALTLGLSDQTLARAQRCLAEAVYWEARSEPESGQVAVAQVVVNRAVSGFYPRDICGVVYQNAHRYLACQFTFACEGRRSLTPTEPQPWSTARRIANDMLAGRLWLAQVGHATHYHANYVSPRWARTMRKKQQIGVHKFFRPREWGDRPQVEVARRTEEES